MKYNINYLYLLKKIWKAAFCSLRKQGGAQRTRGSLALSTVININQPVTFTTHSLSFSGTFAPLIFVPGVQSSIGWFLGRSQSLLRRLSALTPSRLWQSREKVRHHLLCVCEDGLDALTHPVYTAHMLQFSLFSPIWNRWMMQTSWPASQRADIMAHFTVLIFFFIFFVWKGSL